MELNYLKQAEQFVVTAVEIGEKLKNFTLDVDTKRKCIEGALIKLLEQVNSIQGSLDNEDEFQKRITETKMELQKSLVNWKDEISKFAKGYEFMRANEKTMVVMVFGAVKAGKSTIGNFLAGKDFLKIPHDNIYKKIYDNPTTRPQFKIEEKGRVDNLDEEGFREGVIDTTGAIQYFQLGGMKWLDSPGTGAVKKDGDTLNMEELVNRYLDDTDFGVFLITSEQPGLQDDFYYMQELYKRNKPLLVVIAKSDKNVTQKTADGKIMKDEKGKPVRVAVAKDSETRKEQEEYIINEAKNYGINKLDVFSVSVKLAKDALKNQDDCLFESSNMDKFYSLLSEKIGTNAAEIKLANPKNKVNNLIDGIINGENLVKMGSSFKGLSLRIAEIDNLKKEFDKKQSEIMELENRIVIEIFSNLAIKLQDKFNEMRKVIKSGGKVNQKAFSNDLRDMVNTETIRVLNETINEIIGGFNDKVVELDFKMDYTVNVGIKYEKLEKHFKVVNYVRRSPEGIWENIRSIFGKEYYNRESHTETEIENIEVGDNVLEEYDNLLTALKPVIETFVNKELTKLSNSYYLPQIKMFSELISAMKDLKEELTGLKVR